MNQSLNLCNLCHRLNKINFKWMNTYFWFKDDICVACECCANEFLGKIKHVIGLDWLLLSFVFLDFLIVFFILFRMRNQVCLLFMDQLIDFEINFADFITIEAESYIFKIDLSHRQESFLHFQAKNFSKVRIGILFLDWKLTWKSRKQCCVVIRFDVLFIAIDIDLSLL